MVVSLWGDPCSLENEMNLRSLHNILCWAPTDSIFTYSCFPGNYRTVQNMFTINVILNTITFAARTGSMDL